jgi:hypothetical protein
MLINLEQFNVKDFRFFSYDPCDKSYYVTISMHESTISTFIIHMIKDSGRYFLKLGVSSDNLDKILISDEKANIYISALEKARKAWNIEFISMINQLISEFFKEYNKYNFVII